MTSEILQVCKPWFGVDKGMLPVRHPAPKILMTVNYCGRQPARLFVWAAPACHKKEVSAPYPDAHKHNLQYGGLPYGAGWDVEFR